VARLARRQRRDRARTAALQALMLLLAACAVYRGNGIKDKRAVPQPEIQSSASDRRTLEACRVATAELLSVNYAGSDRRISSTPLRFASAGLRGCADRSGITSRQATSAEPALKSGAFAKLT
jgi:hypothetical protein